MIGRLSWYPVVIICLQYRSISWNPNSMCLKGRNSLIKPFPILMVWITSNLTYARHFTTEWKHTNKIVSAPTIEKNEFKYFQLKLTRNLRNLLISRQKNKNILVNQVQNSDFQNSVTSKTRTYKLGFQTLTVHPYTQDSRWTRFSDLH